MTSSRLQKLMLYARNATWIAGERMLRILVSLFLLAYIARHLGPEQFGLLNYALVIVSLSTPVIALGLNRLLVRELVKEQNQSELMGTVFLLKLLASVASVIALAVACYGTELLPQEAHPLIMVAALGNLFMAFDVIDFYFQSQVAAKHTAIYKSAAFIVVSVLKLMLILVDAPLIWFAAAQAIEWAIIAVLASYAYRRYSPHQGRWHFKLPRGSALLKESWPEIGAGVGTVVCMRLDQVMLEHFLNLGAVGIYTAASRLSDLWYFVPAAIVSSTFPAIIKARSTSAEVYKDGLQKMFLATVLSAYAIAVPAAVLAPVIIPLIFGDSYQAASQVLVIHVWGLVAVSLGLCSGSWIFAEGRIILSLYRMALGAICNAALNWLLIPAMGMNGAAFATVISLFTAFYFFDLLSPSMRPLFVMKTRALFLLDARTHLKKMNTEK